MTVTPSDQTEAMNRATPPVSGRRRFDGTDHDRFVFANTGKRNGEKYGLSEEAFWALVRGQDFACAICLVRFHPGGPKMVIDHNHDTGEVRGVLCSKCNWALGAFRDSPDLLRSAVKYLTERGCYGPNDTYVV